MAADRDRFSTATRIRALGEQAAARVYRAQNRRLRRPVRRSRLTGRAALLALVIGALIVALAYPLREYVSQRSEIGDERRKAQDAEERVEELRDEKARWQDPAFVEQQARRHLHYVRPGETGYILPAPPGAQEDGEAERLRNQSAPANRPWYDNLWDGIDKADRAAPVP